MLAPAELEHAALRELSKWPTTGHDAPRPPPTLPPPPAPPDRPRAKPKKRVNPTPTDHAPPQQTPPLAAFAAAADDEAPPPVATRLIARLDAAPARGVPAAAVRRGEAAGGGGPSADEASGDEERLLREIHRASCERELAAHAQAYCALLADGAIPLLPSLKAALRCLLLPAPAAPPDETLLHVAPQHAAGEAVYLATFAHACAYAALLLRGCGAALVAIDARLGATLATNARVAAAAGPPPLGAHVQQASAARLCSRAPLRAHTLPPSWLADPNETGKQFKTAAERGLWSNQQKMYDALLALQREYPCGQPPTLRGGVADFSAAVRERLGQMVSTPGEGGRADKLRAENMRWFAQFVTQRLVQSCLGHDVEPPSLSSNASVHGTVEVDHSKLHQLSRRMSVGSSSPLAASTTGRPSCGGGRGAWSKGPPGSGGDAERRGGARGKSWLGSYFPEGTVEHFWYKLLLALDSHCLFAHLIPLWMARLHQAAAGATPRGEGQPAARPEEPPPRGAPSDGGEPAEEEEQLLRCCVLARFLGFLLALPHCHMDVAGSPAFRAVLREAIAEHHSLAEHAMHRLASMVETARLRGRLALCLPWLGCLLEMMRDDPIASHLAPYRATMQSLQSLARACLPLSFPLANDHARPEAATAGARAAVGLLVLLQTLLQGTPFFPLPDAQGEAAGGAEAGLSLGDEGAREALDRVLFEAKCVAMCCPELGEAQELVRLLGQPRGTPRPLDPPRVASRRVTPTSLGPSASPSRPRLLSGDSSPSSLELLSPGSPPVGGALGTDEIASCLQAMQHSNFWKQRRTLYVALNSALEPIVQAVCADALESLPSLDKSGRPAEASDGVDSVTLVAKRVQAEAHAHAAARLQRLIAALLPGGERPEVAQRALTELVPLVEPAVTLALQRDVWPSLKARLRPPAPRAASRRELFSAPPPPHAAALASTPEAPSLPTPAAAAAAAAERLSLAEALADASRAAAAEPTGRQLSAAAALRRCLGALPHVAAAGGPAAPREGADEHCCHLSLGADERLAPLGVPQSCCEALAEQLMRGAMATAAHGVHAWRALLLRGGGGGPCWPLPPRPADGAPTDWLLLSWASLRVVDDAFGQRLVRGLLHELSVAAASGGEGVSPDAAPLAAATTRAAAAALLALQTEHVVDEGVLEAELVHALDASSGAEEHLLLRVAADMLEILSRPLEAGAVSAEPFERQAPSFERLLAIASYQAHLAGERQLVEQLIHYSDGCVINLG